ncbi:PEP-CTERM sorting domain-containing protein [Aeoliella mucimassa]|uniref:PEP-CTERM protein-sorting domain-containing protein n=1 Tax=Aeoliella mucimassa TaxID=2527972 RepID=A0A518AL98_9BACT|nr:PEP-CTERM sorting domain-containing protein [Aeoliella mucimassa]QDU55505.1 hypothetical protein Pan181_16950 [Aeoliella mucimassa]
MKRLQPKRWLVAWAGAALACYLAGPATAATISLDSSSDTWIRDGRSYSANGIDGVLDARTEFVPYVQFDMSGLDIDSITDAALRLWKVPSARNDTIVTGRYATYGLSDLPGNTLQNWHETDDFDPGDATNGLDFRNTGAEWSPNYTATTGTQANGIDRDLLTSLDMEDGANVVESVNNSTGEIVLTGADLIAFLNSRADDNGLVTFLLPVEADGGRGWGIASKENVDSALHPQLDLTYSANVPEPTSLVLCGLAGAMLLVARRRG